jgi:hypothetical protein
MVEVEKGKYIEDTEVTIGQWLQFIFHAINEQDSVAIKKVSNELLPQKHIIEIWTIETSLIFLKAQVYFRQKRDGQ